MQQTTTTNQHMHTHAPRSSVLVSVLRAGTCNLKIRQALVRALDNNEDGASRTSAKRRQADLRVSARTYDNDNTFERSRVQTSNRVITLRILHARTIASSADYQNNSNQPESHLPLAS
jgi:hypothetical protein